MAIDQDGALPFGFLRVFADDLSFKLKPGFSAVKWVDSESHLDHVANGELDSAGAIAC